MYIILQLVLTIIDNIYLRRYTATLSSGYVTDIIRKWNKYYINLWSLFLPNFRCSPKSENGSDDGVNQTYFSISGGGGGGGGGPLNISLAFQDIMGLISH